MNPAYFENFPHSIRVHQFHTTFNHPIRSRPDLSDEKLNTLRAKLLQEEVGELVSALEAKDVVATLDALVDIQVVLDGAVLALGFAPVMDLAFNEVMDSNMSKQNPDGSVSYREDGKIQKGPNYYAPNLTAILKSEWPDLL